MASLSFKNWMVLVALGFLFACAPTETETDVEALQEIPTDGSISNADIVRNPISADEMVDPDQVAVITFAEESYDFGEVKEGDIVEHRFSFQNTGKVPLIISNARSTCGCTVPEWPEEPIAPGEGGEISVRFDTKNKGNQQSKPITITANTIPARTKIYLKGIVVE